LATNSPTIPLSNLTDGVNTFERQAGPNQCVDALDVWERDGDLQRRPAFKPIVCGPVHFLPCGSVLLKHEYPLNTFTTYTERFIDPITMSQTGGSTGRLWIGCTVPFDGIDGYFDSLIDSGSAISLVVKYRNTSLALVAAHGVVDTTSAYAYLIGGHGDTKPFNKAGRVSWHQSQFDDWTATVLDGHTRYWIALDFALTPPIGGDATPAVTAGSAAYTFGGTEGPGIRAFTTAAINGLYAARLNNTTPVLIMGADRIPVDMEAGGNLGYSKSPRRATEEAFIIDREGSGVLDQIVTPAWTHTGAATGTLGASGVLTKFDQSFEWNINEQAGAVIASALPVTSFTSESAFVLTMNNAGLGVRKPFKNYFLRVAAAGTTSGLNVGDTVEVVSCTLVAGTSATVTVYPALADIASDTTFDLLTRPNELRTRQEDNAYLIASNTAHTATPMDISEIVPALPTADGLLVNFQTGTPAIWTVPKGEFWSFLFNPVTGRVLATNGASGILEYDGISTRRLEALWDDTDGVPGSGKVQIVTGYLEDVALELNAPDINAGSELRRKPPDAKLLAYYRGHIVVSLRSEPNKLYWTTPNAFNDMWPLVYATEIRDSESSPITGLYTLNEQLVATTANGVWAANPPSIDQYIVFNPVAQGFGFVGQNATVKIALGGSSMIVGPNADGIYGFTGASPQDLLEDWRQVIPGGINTRLLDKACGAAWQQENLYFLAVPSKGSVVNDRIIVMDYSGLGANQPIKFWVWTAPFGGITSMCTDHDAAGGESILFGTADGHVCVLADMLCDCNEPITGRAKSPPMYFEGRTMAFTGAKMTMEELGTNDTITLRTFINSGRTRQELSKTIRAGGALYGTGVYDTATFADARLVTKQLNFRAGGSNAATPATLDPPSVGEVFQFEIESTSRFKLRAIQLQASPKGIRGK
jgi:hypothetical protein